MPNPIRKAEDEVVAAFQAHPVLTAALAGGALYVANKERKRRYPESRVDDDDEDDDEDQDDEEDED